MKQPQIQIVHQSKQNLTSDELFKIAVRLCKDCPELIEEIQRTLADTTIIRNNINCPFPWKCSRWPCHGLQCYADALDNGNPVKEY
jgi:hypothetical protein